MKTGSWSACFEISLEGESIRFEDLSETSQEHILALMAEGFRSGEVVECDDREV